MFVCLLDSHKHISHQGVLLCKQNLMLRPRCHQVQCFCFPPQMFDYIGSAFHFPPWVSLTLPCVNTGFGWSVHWTTEDCFPRVVYLLQDEIIKPLCQYTVSFQLSLKTKKAPKHPVWYEKSWTFREKERKVNVGYNVAYFCWHSTSSELDLHKRM